MSTNNGAAEAGDEAVNASLAPTRPPSHYIFWDADRHIEESLKKLQLDSDDEEDDDDDDDTDDDDDGEKRADNAGRSDKFGNGGESLVSEDSGDDYLRNKDLGCKFVCMNSNMS